MSFVNLLKPLWKEQNKYDSWTKPNHYQTLSKVDRKNYSCTSQNRSRCSETKWQQQDIPESQGIQISLTRKERMGSHSVKAERTSLRNTAENGMGIPSPWFAALHSVSKKHMQRNANKKQ